MDVTFCEVRLKLKYDYKSSYAHKYRYGWNAISFLTFFITSSIFNISL